MRKIKPNTIYRHFKGNLYLVEGIVVNSETNENMVLYRALYNKCLRYVRPIDMFLSEVDHDKYKEVKQKYRFEEIKLESKVK